MKNKNRFMNKEMNNKLKIFNNNINNKYKLIPFNLKLSNYREKYAAPASNEWKNTAYFYNQNNIKNIPLNDQNLNKIIQSYFNLHLRNKFLRLRHMSLKRKRSLLKRMYVSNVEIKHTNNKAIITLYVLNTKKNKLFKNYLKSKTKFRNLIFYFSRIKKNILQMNISLFRSKLINNFLSNKFILRGSKVLEFKFELLNKIVNYSNLIFNRCIKKMFNKFKFVRKMNVLRRDIYLYKINILKFQKVYFLHRLNNLLLKILNKKIEFNIVNLTSLVFNTDIFTKALALKLKKKKFFVVMRAMNSVISRARLPRVNTGKERRDLTKYMDLELVHNKYQDSHLLSNLNDTEKFIMFLQKNKVPSTLGFKLDYIGLTLKLHKRYKEYLKRFVFNAVQHKNLGGIRLEVRGRLTRRNRADRAIYKLKWKGGLKNIESSFNGLSSVVYRGQFKPNVTYSKNNSKRSIGAFAVKGWISSK